MSNVNKTEFDVFTWKTKMSDLVMGLCNLVLFIFILFGDMEIVQKAILVLIFFGFGSFWTIYYFKDLLRTKYKKNTEERRMELKKDLSSVLGRYIVRPRVEGSEEESRMNVKLVLAELAEEY